jgi:hypothetical protein
MHGRPAGMPAFSSMLPGRTVWELVAYVRSLQEIEDYAAVKGFDVPSPSERSSQAEADDGATLDIAAR